MRKNARFSVSDLFGSVVSLFASVKTVWENRHSLIGPSLDRSRGHTYYMKHSMCGKHMDC